MKQMMLALTTVFTLTAIASTTQAQGLTFAPSKGQSAEQQAKDGAECQAVAVQQSGFDPARAQAAATPSQPAAGGERARGAARGAAVGAAAGAIGGDAGKGAAAGAAAGTVAGGSKKRQAGREQEAQAQQQQAAAAQGQGAFDKALITCMQGRGYLMK
jgi:hypothetical protein